MYIDMYMYLNTITYQAIFEGDCMKDLYWLVWDKGTNHLVHMLFDSW